MNFTEMRDLLIKHFAEMTKDVDHLFEVSVDKDKLWNTYLDSFPHSTNEIYRERREHDCSCCRNFVKTIGNAVTIKNGVLTTIWDFETGDSTYQPVLNALSAFIKKHAVSDVYVSKFSKIGTLQNYEEMEGGKITTWTHFFVELSPRFVDKSSRSVGDIKGGFRDTRNVFKRSLDEISMDAIDTILELIRSNSLYKGEEWNGALTEFRKYKKEYDALPSDTAKELYAWEKSVSVGVAIGRIRNHSIGTLLTNISDNMELDLAVKKYEDIVAGVNYKRPKPIYTERMIKELEKDIIEMGYENSLKRRFANLDDITVNNILFSNKDSAKRISGSDNIFRQMENEAAVNPKKFSKVEEISAKDFIDNVLPTAKEVEALVENKHINNFVSLIAPVDPDSKTMFKWNNGLSWAYTGNITDSNIRQNVKSAGGNVDGVLRFSIQWNENGTDNCDLDAHCVEPNGNEIFFGSDRKPYISRLGGQLDVDIVTPMGNVAVENITWADKARMKSGIYKFFVHQYSGFTTEGFRAEIAFDGELYEFDYSNGTRSGEKIQVAEVILDADGNFSIKKILNRNTKISSKDVWGVHTNQFVPVSVISYSPNYFDEQDGIGHRHLFFFLKECLNPENPNGFYNEFLDNELIKHRKALEALGSRCHVEDADDQLSGIGFSMTKRAELIVKVKGATERVMKIKF